MLDTGVHATAGDLARAKGVAPSYVSRILRPTLLAPEIVEAILDGRQRAELQLDDLLEGFPVEWEMQASPFGAHGSVPFFRAPGFTSDGGLAFVEVHQGGSEQSLCSASPAWSARWSSVRRRPR